MMCNHSRRRQAIVPATEQLNDIAYVSSKIGTEIEVRSSENSCLAMAFQAVPWAMRCQPRMRVAKFTRVP
jgi:hypothetical protein